MLLRNHLTVGVHRLLSWRKRTADFSQNLVSNGITEMAPVAEAWLSLEKRRDHTQLCTIFLLSLPGVLTSVLRSVLLPLRHQRCFLWTQPAVLCGRGLWGAPQVTAGSTGLHTVLPLPPTSLVQGRRPWQCSVTLLANALGNPRVPKLLLWGMGPSKHEFIKFFHEVPCELKSLRTVEKNQRWILWSFPPRAHHLAVRKITSNYDSF